MLNLRPAIPADIDSLIRLLEQLFTIEQDFTVNPDNQRRGLELMMQSDTAYMVVAEQADEVVGMASLQILISTADGGRAGLIEDLVVNAEHRGMGIGRSLIEHLIGWAEQQGLTRLQLLADLDNQPALDFYTKQNWQRTRLLAFRKILQ